MNPPSVKWVDCLQFNALTHVGMRRSNNQDDHSVVLAKSEEIWAQKGHVLVVADGMGGHAAGELASQMAVRGVTQLFHQYEDLTPAHALYQAIVKTNREIHRRGEENPEFHKLGTTVSALVLLPEGALVGHVGDSRIYRLRNNTLEQLTFDHSLVWELEASRQLSKNSELAAMVPSNVITRSLGPNVEVQVDIEGPFPIQQGDRFLLCTDGVTGDIEDEEIAAIIANLRPWEAAQFLIDLANDRGGSDNSTVIVGFVAGDQIITHSDPEEEKTKEEEPAPVRRMHPGFMIGAFLMMVVAYYVGYEVHWIAGSSVAIISFLLLGLGIWLGRAYRQEKTEDPVFTPPQGKGPYTSTPCKVTRTFLDSLIKRCNKWKQWAEKNQANIEWSSFNEFTTKAASAVKKRNYNKATRLYALAFSFMMKEVRFQKLKQPGESHDD